MRTNLAHHAEDVKLGNLLRRGLGDTPPRGTVLDW